MKNKIQDIFGMNCMKCNRHDKLMEMTFNEDSVVLCPECISTYRIEKMIDISKKLFIISLEKDWKSSWIYK